MNRADYIIPATYAPKGAKQGDRIVDIERKGDGWYVSFGFAGEDDAGRFEWRCARSENDRSFKSVAGAMRAAQAWISRKANPHAKTPKKPTRYFPVLNAAGERLHAWQTAGLRKSIALLANSDPTGMARRMLAGGRVRNPAMKAAEIQSAIREATSGVPREIVDLYKVSALAHATRKQIETAALRLGARGTINLLRRDGTVYLVARSGRSMSRTTDRPARKNPSGPLATLRALATGDTFTATFDNGRSGTYRVTRSSLYNTVKAENTTNGAAVTLDEDGPGVAMVSAAGVAGVVSIRRAVKGRKNPQAIPIASGVTVNPRKRKAQPHKNPDPVTKPGKHGTLYLFAVEVAKGGRIGAPYDHDHLRLYAYDADHAENRVWDEERANSEDRIVKVEKVRR